MSFYDNIKEKSKSDPLRFWGFTAVIVVLLFSLVLGVVYSDENKVDDTKVVGVEVPVDTTGIVSNSKTGPLDDDFFSDENNEEIIIDNQPEVKTAIAVQSDRYVPTKKSYTYKPLNLEPENKKIEKVDLVTEVKTTSVSSGARRRAPSDALGNMSGTKSVSSKSLYNCVMFNGNRAIKSGSYVTMRTSEIIIVDNVTIPKNTIITGVATLSAERMGIEVSSIKLNSGIQKVKWIIYDIDANFGVAIPQNILNDIGSDVAEEALSKDGSKVDVNVPVVGNVKVNLKKRVKEVSFVVPDGHKLYIKMV